MRYEFRHFPLSSIHAQAQQAAEAAECAGEQGKFWEMHDALFNSQDQWAGNAEAEQAFMELAGDLDLDQAQFDACLEVRLYADKVSYDYQEGLASGVSGTPAFRINGVALSGAQPFEAFQQQIEYFLAGGEPPTLEVAADSYRSLGSPDAPVVVTEFSDYQCPACASVEAQVIPELIKQYVDTGKVRFVYREFPLDSLHPNARAASIAAVCAGQQDKYWEMHDKLFASQAEWGAEGEEPTSYFEDYADELGLSTGAFQQCLESQEAAVAVQGELMAGEAFGVNATPYFFIKDLPIRGGLPIESLGQIIDYVAAGGQRPEILPTGEDWHLRGNRQTARAITVAFVDYSSPESAQHALEVLPELAKEYIDTGELIYVLHPWAAEAGSPGARGAIAAECAGEQGEYWEMHDLLFEEQASWSQTEDTSPLFTTYAESLGLDTAQFQDCLESEQTALKVQAGNVLAALYGVPGAPVFLFNNNQAQQGSPSLDEFKAIIDSIVNQ